MASTARELRDSIKSYMGFETDDLADSLIDDWIRAAMRRLNSENEWPWQLKFVTATVPAGGDIDGGYELKRARRILEVIRDDTRPLRSIEFGKALETWPDGGSAARPTHYTVFGASTGTMLRLWPGEDSDEYEVTVRYYEWPEEWPKKGTPPTTAFPIYEGAYEAIYRWVLNEALLREAQTAEASTMRAMYHQQVALLRDQLQVIPDGVRVGADNRISGGVSY